MKRPVSKELLAASSRPPSDLDARIRDWRERQERDSSLSPRELDELEDHLRTRVDLEMELNAELPSERAFAAARAAIGEGGAVSREFAKAGKRRWRRLLVAGWALFGASFLLPALYVPDAGLGLSRPFGLRPYYGYEVFQELLVADGELFVRLVVLAALSPCLAMLVISIPALRNNGRWAWTVMRYALSVAGLGTLALGFVPVHFEEHGELVFAQHLGIGYWAWSLSFVCAAAALWVRDHDGASVRAKQSVSPE